MNVLKGRFGERPRKLVSLDKTHLAVGFSAHLELGKTIRIFNWITGGELRKLIGHTRDVLALTKLDNKQIASGSCDTTIKTWNWTSGRLVNNLTGHTDWVNDLLPLANFSQILSCSYDKTIRLWNQSSGNLIKNLKEHSAFAKSIILLKENLIASGSGDGTVGIWNLTKGNRIKNLTGHSGAIYSLINIDNSRTIASSSIDWKIKIWTVDTGKC
jgi:WD40 repeat protein